jgi:flavin reductase (DIM6/NTAB) family NADH-FMN oxidoreductase RutF
MDKQALRKALGQFATGIVLITTRHGDRTVGVTVNSFTSVSLDPPLILWCLGRSSSRYGYFADARSFTASVLNLSHKHISTRLSQSGEHILDEEHLSRNSSSQPALSEALASFDCEREAGYPAGDHLVIIGRVTNFAWREEAPALLYFRGQYREMGH